MCGYYWRKFCKYVNLIWGKNIFVSGCTKKHFKHIIYWFIIKYCTASNQFKIFQLSNRWTDFMTRKCVTRNIFQMIYDNAFLSFSTFQVSTGLFALVNHVYFNSKSKCNIYYPWFWFFSMSKARRILTIYIRLKETFH